MARLTAFKEVRHVADLNYPDDPKLEDGVLYVVDDSPYVQFNCPCGCGGNVMLPTTKHEKGYSGWRYTETNGEVTLAPSILSSGFPCRSHYFIRNNRIDWC